MEKKLSGKRTTKFIDQKKRLFNKLKVRKRKKYKEKEEERLNYVGKYSII